MKIDEGCINHNTVRLIKEIVGNPWEYCDADQESDCCRQMTLGTVYGILLMAEELKGVLKE